MKTLVILLAAVVAYIPSHAGAGETVRRGDSGPVVTEVQTLLSGYSYTVAIDGKFGPQTERAVKSWQRSNGLTIDGIVGSETLTSLRSARRMNNATQVTPTLPPPPPPSSAIDHYDEWMAIAQCESRGRWDINTGNGYYGGLQFSLTSWRAVGGQGYPHQASKEEQMLRAERLLDLQGWGAWPACTRQLGLR